MNEGIVQETKADGTFELDQGIAGSGGTVYETMTQMDDAAIRAELERHWSVTGVEDPALVHAIYDENVIVEYLQSHETIHGRANLEALREAYPATLTITVKRIRGQGNLWVSEYVIAYDGKPVNIVSTMEFAHGKTVRETLYFADPCEAPTWRSQWVSPGDPFSPTH